MNLWIFHSTGHTTAVDIKIIVFLLLEFNKVSQSVKAQDWYS